MNLQCPCCLAELTEDQVFDLVNNILAERARNCPHLYGEQNPNDPSQQICGDCGYVQSGRAT